MSVSNLTHALAGYRLTGNSLLGRGTGRGKIREIHLGTGLEIDENDNLNVTVEGGPGGGISGLTTGKIPKAASSSTLTDSPITVSGSNITTAGTITAGGSITSGGTGGGQLVLPDSGLVKTVTLKTQTIGTTFNWILPADAATGVVYATASGVDVTLSHIATQGTGNLVRFTKRTTVVATGVTIAANVDNSDIIQQTHTGAAGTLTFSNPTGTPVNGQSILYQIKATNAQTPAWGNLFAFGDMGAPTSIPGGVKLTQLVFVWCDMISKYVFTGYVPNVS